MFSFDYKIKCDNCGHEFYYSDRATIKIDDPFHVRGEFPADACPVCNKWLLSFKTYYADGQPMSQVSGGSAMAIYKRNWNEL